MVDDDTQKAAAKAVNRKKAGKPLKKRARVTNPNVGKHGKDGVKTKSHTHYKKDGYDIRTCEMRFAEKYMSGMTFTEAYIETHETIDLGDGAIRARAQMLIKTDRVKLYLKKIRGENAQGINIHVKPGTNDTSAVLKLMEAFEDFSGDVIVTEQTQQRKLEMCVMYSMVKGQYNWASSAIKMQSELAGLLIDRKEIRVGNFNDMSPGELMDARKEAARGLLDMGYSEDDMEWALKDVTEIPHTPPIASLDDEPKPKAKPETGERRKNAKVPKIRLPEIRTGEPDPDAAKVEVMERPGSQKKASLITDEDLSVFDD